MDRKHAHQSSRSPPRQRQYHPSSPQRYNDRDETPKKWNGYTWTFNTKAEYEEFHSMRKEKIEKKEMEAEARKASAMLEVFCAAGVIPPPAQQQQTPFPSSASSAKDVRSKKF